MNETELEELNRRFENAMPQEILKWAISTYSPQIALSSSFGAESAALLHMATQIEPRIPIIFINTGFLFQETSDFMETLKKRLNLTIREYKADEKSRQQIQKRLDSPDNQAGACCDEVKVELMQKSLEGLSCWIAGLRRNQSSTRKNIQPVESYRTGLVNVHPI